MAESSFNVAYFATQARNGIAAISAKEGLFSNPADIVVTTA